MDLDIFGALEQTLISSIAGDALSLLVDATIYESHSSTLRITSSPVDAGADVTDHAIVQPKEFEMYAVISDLSDSAMGGIGGLISGVGGKNSVAGYNALLMVQKSRIPLYVQSGLYLYKNLLIESLRVDREASTAGALFFNAYLREVRLVSTQLSYIDGGSYLENGSQSSDGTGDRTKSESDLGLQQGTSVSNNEVGNSTLFDLFG